MEDALGELWNKRQKYSMKCLNPYSNGKMNTQSQRAEGHLNLLANVGIISGKSKICGEIEYEK